MGLTRTVSSALAVILISIVFAGCAEVYFHTSSTHRYPANPPTCRIRLVASDPGQDFEEIGTLSVDGDPRAFRDPNIFLQESRERVCRAGGELIVTQVNGFGSIVRGVVFRRTRENAEAVEAGDEACDPICSPGFVCNETKCLPVCNPACDASEVCGRDRLCHSRTGTADGYPAR